MSSFTDLASELVGRLPGLSPFLAETFIKDSWNKIRNKRTWSFLMEDATIVCPAQIVSGTFAITQFSATAIGSAAARTALLAQQATGQPVITALQIRFMGSAQTGQIYNIVSYVDTAPTITLTLDRVVQEATNVGSPFLCYRAYIVPPAADFLRFLSLTDMVNGFTITGPRLVGTSARLDVTDPQRQAFGFAYYCYFYKYLVASSQPAYELWPAATNGQVFWAKYRRKGTNPDFSDPTAALPAMIDDEIVTQYALGAFAYPFAKANAGHFPSFKGANWPELITTAMKLYADALTDAIKQDDNQATQSVYNQGRQGYRSMPTGFYGPVDAKFIQGHPIVW